MDVKITLTPGYSTNVDNFTIYSAISGGGLVSRATGITRAQLAAGYTITGLPAETTGGTVNSTGVCTSSVDWIVVQPPVSTCRYWEASISQIDIADAIGNVANPTRNGIVFVGYQDCNGNEQLAPFGMEGSFNQAFCAMDGATVTGPYYYKYDNQVSASNSMVQMTEVPCS